MIHRSHGYSITDYHQSSKASGYKNPLSPNPHKTEQFDLKRSNFEKISHLRRACGGKLRRRACAPDSLTFAYAHSVYLSCTFNSAIWRCGIPRGCILRTAVAGWKPALGLTSCWTYKSSLFETSPHLLLSSTKRKVHCVYEAIHHDLDNTQVLKVNALLEITCKLKPLVQ